MSLRRKTYIKRGGKLRAKSKKRPPRENLDVRRDYSDTNPFCELWNLLKDSLNCKPSAQLWVRQWMQMTKVDADRTAQVHHIFQGNGKRFDVESNLISISDAAHNRFCHNAMHATIPGRVACLWVKQSKGELDRAEMKAVCGMYIEGWLDQDRIREGCEPYPFWDELRIELLESIEGE